MLTAELRVVFDEKRIAIASSASSGCIGVDALGAQLLISAEDLPLIRWHHDSIGLFMASPAGGGTMVDWL